MTKQESINNHGIKYHKRKVKLRRLKNRIRKNFSDILEILKITGEALIFLVEMWALTVTLTILF